MQSCEPRVELARKCFPRENPIRPLAEKWYDGSSYELVAGYSAIVAALGVEGMVAILTYKPDRDEIDVEEIREFGVEEKDHFVPAKEEGRVQYLRRSDLGKKTLNEIHPA